MSGELTTFTIHVPCPSCGQRAVALGAGLCMICRDKAEHPDEWETRDA